MTAIVGLTVMLHGLVAALGGASILAILGAMAVAAIGCNLGLALCVVGALVIGARA